MTPPIPTTGSYVQCIAGNSSRLASEPIWKGKLYCVESVEVQPHAICPCETTGPHLILRLVGQTYETLNGFRFGWCAKRFVSLMPGGNDGNQRQHQRA